MVPCLFLVLCALPFHFNWIRAESVVLDSCAAEMDEFQSFLSMVEPSYWGTGYRMNLARFGDYVTMLSNFMISCNSNFQFFSIGSDSTIDSFFDASHWNGLFVEADDKNIRILKGEIAARRATHRSVVLHAAAVDICDSHMIQFARPREDADAGRDGHLLKRSIGRVLVRGIQELPPAKRNRWVVDLVPCYTADQILSEWENSSPVSTHTPGSKHKIHLLKIDTGGSSLGVLKGFMYDVHSRFELPVLIMTEVRNSASKSSQENMCAETQKLLSSMGYIVSNCGQDIFAMLRPENI